jgi:hypothetical protein
MHTTVLHCCNRARPLQVSNTVVVRLTWKSTRKTWSSTFDKMSNLRAENFGNSGTETETLPITQHELLHNWFRQQPPLMFQTWLESVDSKWLPMWVKYMHLSYSDKTILHLVYSYIHQTDQPTCNRPINYSNDALWATDVPFEGGVEIRN